MSRLAPAVRLTVASLLLATFVAPPAGAAAGDILVADLNAFGGTGGVIRVDPASGERTTVSENTAPAGGPSFENPARLAFEADGDILVVDQTAFGGTGGVIRVDPATGARTTVSANTMPAGGPSFESPYGIALETDGNILVTDLNAFGGTGAVIRVDPATGTRTTVSANGAPAEGPTFGDPNGIAIEPDGDILVADHAAFSGTGGVIRVDPITGTRTTVSANGAPAGEPSFATPVSVALAPNGDILVIDLNAFPGGGVIRVSPVTGERTTVSQNTAPPGEPSFEVPHGIAVEADGDILVTDLFTFGGTGGVIRVDPVAGARATVSENSAPAGEPNFVLPNGIAVEPSGERAGTFSCSASALRFGSLEPLRANPADAPCRTEQHALARATTSGVVASQTFALRVATEQAPDPLGPTPAVGDRATGHASVDETTIRVGLNTIVAGDVVADAAAACTGVDVSPTLTGSGHVKRLVVNGVPRTVSDAHAHIPLILGTLHVNHTETTPGSVVQQALRIETAFSTPTIVSEARADFEGNPCAAH